MALIVCDPPKFEPTDVLGDGTLLLSGEPISKAEWDVAFAAPFNVRRILRCLPVDPSESDCLTKECRGDDFVLLQLPINDLLSEDISPFLPKAVDFIASGIASGHVVHVHCASGVSRSVSCVLAFLVAGGSKKNKMDLRTAYSYLKERRPQVSPNLSFFAQLLEFEKKVFGTDTASIDIDEYVLSKYKVLFVGPQLSFEELKALYEKHKKPRNPGFMRMLIADAQAAASAKAKEGDGSA